MQVTKISSISGIEHTMELDITQAELANWMKSDILIQYAFPHLTPTEREFLLTGITAEEWEENFADDEDEDYEANDLSEETF